MGVVFGLTVAVILIVVIVFAVKKKNVITVHVFLCLALLVFTGNVFVVTC